MLERTVASERPLPTQGSLIIALTPSPGSALVPGRSVLCWHYCCLAWHPVCSLCAVPEGGSGSPHLFRSPPSCPVALAAQRTCCAHRLRCSLHPLLPSRCCLGSHPQTSTFGGSVWILGLGLSEHGSLVCERWLLLHSSLDGARQQWP